MNISILCWAVKNGICKLAQKSDHSGVVDFQKEIAKLLKEKAGDYKWEIEFTHSGRAERDAVDIMGRASGNPNWVIEIDATRSDQVSQKFLSRLVLWGLKEPINYVAILYPDTQNGKSACEKYLRYGHEIFKKVNRESSITGIFVEPDSGSVEVLDFDSHSRFDVNGKVCDSMSAAAAEAVKLYIDRHHPTIDGLKKVFGKFVDCQYGPNRYKDIKISSSDGIPVHTYTQFREHGTCSYWEDFVGICKDNKIVIRRLRKYYIGPADGKSPYEYR